MSMSATSERCGEHTVAAAAAAAVCACPMEQTYEISKPLPEPSALCS